MAAADQQDTKRLLLGMERPLALDGPACDEELGDVPGLPARGGAHLAPSDALERRRPS